MTAAVALFSVRPVHFCEHDIYLQHLEDIYFVEKVCECGESLEKLKYIKTIQYMYKLWKLKDIHTVQYSF